MVEQESVTAEDLQQPNKIDTEDKQSICQKRADVAVLVDYFRRMKPGESMSYEQMSEIIGKDARANRDICNKVKQVMLNEHKVVIASVRCYGYKVLSGKDVADSHLANDRRARRRHALRSRKKAATVDVRELDQPTQLKLAAETAAANIAYEVSKQKTINQLNAKVSQTPTPLQLKQSLDVIIANMK